MSVNHFSAARHAPSVAAKPPTKILPNFRCSPLAECKTHWEVNVRLLHCSCNAIAVVMSDMEGSEPDWRLAARVAVTQYGQ
jgi:hypothetical protein